MINPKVLNAFNNLKEQSNNIRQKLDAFTGDTLKWADELGEILEKEFSATRGTSSFLLPKTPFEKKTRARNGRKGLGSKCSVINSTHSQNETSQLDNTVSLRTRGAKRTVPSKMSQLIDSSVIKIKGAEKDTTFVLPRGSTRTKPVTEPEPTVAESHQVLESSGNSENELSFKSVASSQDASHQQKPRTQSNCPAHPPNPTGVPIAVSETPVERPSRSRRESPPQRITRSDPASKSESGSPAVRSSRAGVTRSSSNSSVTRLSSKKRRSRSQSGVRGSSNVSSGTSREVKSSVPETRGLLGNETITVTKEGVRKGSYDIFESMNDNEKTLVARNEDFRLSRQSTFAMEVESTPVVSEQNGFGMEQMELEENLLSSARTGTLSDGVVQEISEGARVAKKKRKVRKDEEVKENVEEMADTMRITRTKSKAMKKMMEESEAKQAPRKANVASRSSSVENLVRTASKPPKDDLDKEIKLESKKEKEEEAALKRQNVMKAKQEKLKRKNELKHQMAMKQREKLGQENYHNMIQLEKEKEERHKLLLQERQNQLKKQVFEKKMRTRQKIAETVETRRVEEETRLAKLMETVAEEKRLALEKQREQERQERLAQKKAQEGYELKLKQELEAEKLLNAKKCLPSANKKQKFGGMDKREWDYKPRHEKDYGLEDERSEVDSDCETSCDKAKRGTAWGKRVVHRQCPALRVLTLEMLCQFMPCHRKSPDIYKMFRMTPSKRIKRSSSAIWNTPSS